MQYVTLEPKGVKLGSTGFESYGWRAVELESCRAGELEGWRVVELESWRAGEL